MTGSAIGLSLNFGFAGTVSRTPDCIIDSFPVKSDSAAIKFGQPVVLNTAGTYQSINSATLTAANFAGIAVAQVKSLTSYPTTTDDVAGEYKAGQAADVLKRGVISVKLAQGNPTAGGAVYVRTVLNTGDFPLEAVGDFRAAADSTNTVQLTNCCWATNRKDANNITELKVRNINN